MSLFQLFQIAFKLEAMLSDHDHGMQPACLLKVFHIIYRPRSNWTTEYTNCQMGASDIWFQSSTKIHEQRHIEKSFFFSVEEVQYNRDISCAVKVQVTRTTSNEKSPQHFLTVVGELQC